jgi:hypothetical protein
MTQQAVDEQAQAATGRVLALYAMHRAGQLARPDAVAAIAQAVYVGKVLASRLADIWISTISNLPPLGITPGPRHVERLEEAVATVLDEAEQAPEDEPQDPAERLERLATAETLNSHRATLHACIRDHGFPEWQRVTGDDPCEKCAPLAGEVQPVTVGFKDHPGCQCTLIPHGEPNSEKETETQPMVRIRRIA